MTAAERPLPHWLTVATGPAAVFDGRACRTRAAFFDEAVRVLRLPDYFGRNWDALTDSLRDVTRPLIVEHAEHLLSAEPPGQFATLLAVLSDADVRTVTLCTDPATEPALRTRIAAALR
jgi:RNAse (barnase) inhibitor barstar